MPSNNQKHFIENHIDEIRKLYEDEELSTKQIGDILGIPQSTILKWLYMADIKVRSSGKYFGTDNPDKVSAILDMQKKGICVAEISRKIDISPYIIRKVLSNNLGANYRDNYSYIRESNLTSDQKYRIASLYNRGTSIEDIQEQVYVSYDTIVKISESYEYAGLVFKEEKEKKILNRKIFKALEFLSIREIQYRFNVSKNRVIEAIKTAFVDLNSELI